MVYQKTLPQGSMGVGLRPKFYENLLQNHHFDYLEIISENFMFDQPIPNHYLSKLRMEYPIVLHGVSLNLLGSEDLDLDYLRRLKLLSDNFEAPFFSDHLCWSQRENRFHHDLLPTPFRKDLVQRTVDRAKFVQDYVGRPFAIENLSSYLTFKESDMPEWEFYSTIVEKSDCMYLLDINNIYVSSVNHKFDPRDYIERIDFTRVSQVHLAGHDSSNPNLIVDTHDRSVSDSVWDLYGYALQKGAPFPTLIEWDENIPDLETVYLEAEKAKILRKSIEASK